MSSFDQRVKLILNTIGTKKVLNDFKKVEAGLMSFKKINQKYRISGKDWINKQNTLKSQAMITQNQEKQQKKRAYLKRKFLDWDIEATKKQNKKKKRISRKYNRSRRKEATRFRGEYLSVMFAGMQLQRAFGGLFKKMISTYKEFTKNAATPLSNSLTRLEANWKFLKFSMVDAAGPILTQLTGFFANMARKISAMDKSQIRNLTLLIGSLAGIGGLSFVFGQGAILFTSIASAVARSNQLKSLESTMREVNGMDSGKLSKGSKFFTSMRKAAGVGVIALSIKDSIEGINDLSKKNYGDAILNAASAAMGYATGAKLIKGGKGAGVWATGYIALKLLEKDMLGKSFMSIVGTISGVFSGIIDIATVYSARFGDLLEGSPLGDFLGISKSPMRAEIANISVKDAFTTGFKNLFAEGHEMGKKFDDWTSDMKNKLNMGEDITPKKGRLTLLPSERQGKPAKETYDKYLRNKQREKEMQGEIDTSLGRSVDSLLSLTGYLRIINNNELPRSVNKADLFKGAFNATKNIFKKSLPEEVTKFLNDDEKGMAAAQREAENLNSSLGKTIDKTVNVTVNRSYSDVNPSIFP